ncbi:SGNH/GDSL hydrolase family protein [Kitasatospora sp. NPDC008115]|uniref:SGNH/GDSL hydrolase family protein n=1 Tax=Kitasatospora sp. NPDC008115 TaxID=3364022 RepID=UPI0036E86067
MRDHATTATGGVPRTTRRLLSVLTSAVVAAGGLAAGSPAGAATDRFERYVALGDSYAAYGSVSKNYGTPAGCTRARDNYPNQLAASLGLAASFVDVTCGDARTISMTVPEALPGGAVNPPQFDALKPGTDLVTVTIGAKDALSDILVNCAVIAGTDPQGNPCERTYTASGTDPAAAAIDAVRPGIEGVLDGIRERSPHATVVLVGYLSGLPPTTGCWPDVPIARGDVPYAYGLQKRMNAVLGAAAASRGAIFSNPGDVLGHDACQPPGVRWVEPLDPAPDTNATHPNAAGQAYVAALTRSLLR